MAPHFDINVILVGRDAYSAAELTRASNVVEFAQHAFESHGLPIGAVGRYHLDLAKVGSLVVPKSRADLIALGQRWAVPDEALDVFIVPMMAIGTLAGWSPVGGSCNKRSTKGVRAPVASLTENVLLSGVIFVHEVAHCLGLEHCPSLCGPNNFMEPLAYSTHTEFTPEQVTQMKQHCFVKP
jgi:hypothetical protein